MNAVIRFGLSRAAPAAVIFAYSSILGGLLGLPGAPCKFWGAPGAPESPENMSGTMLGTPLGARGGPGVDFRLIWAPF